MLYQTARALFYPTSGHMRTLDVGMGGLTFVYFQSEHNSFSFLLKEVVIGGWH